MFKRIDDNLWYNGKMFWVKGLTPTGHHISGGMYEKIEVAEARRDAMELSNQLKMNL